MDTVGGVFAPERMLILLTVFVKALPCVIPMSLNLRTETVHIYSVAVLIIDSTGSLNLIVPRIRSWECAVMNQQHSLTVGAFYHSGDNIALGEGIIRKVIVLSLSIFKPGIESPRFARH